MNHRPPVHVDKYPNPHCRKFFKMLNSVDSPLFEGCKNHIKMFIIDRLTNMKANHRLTERCYNDTCAIVSKVLLVENTKTNYMKPNIKKVALGLPVEKIDFVLKWMYDIFGELCECKLLSYL